MDCVSCDICTAVVCLCFFPGVFLGSRVTGMVYDRGNLLDPRHPTPERHSPAQAA